MRIRVAILLAPAMLSLGLTAGCRQSDTFKLTALCAGPAAPVPDTPSAPYRVYRDCTGDDAPTAQFDGPGGKKFSFAQFAGKPFLVTIWKASGADCARQLAALNAVAATGNIRIVAIDNAIGESDPGAAATYLAAHDFTALTAYRSKEGRSMMMLHANHLPATALYDARGKNVWRMWGVADFASPAGRALLAETR